MKGRSPIGWMVVVLAAGSLPASALAQHGMVAGPAGPVALSSPSHEAGGTPGPGPRLVPPPRSVPWQATSLAHPKQQLVTHQPHGAAGLALGGLAGGAVGFLAGGLAGAALCQCGTGDDGYEVLLAAFLGATAGVALAMPIGAHLANGGHGNLWYSLAASVGIASVGVIAAVAANDETASPVFILMIPVGQLVSTVLIERGTTR